MKLFNKEGCINTYSGLTFDFNDPQPEQINIIDIAKGLSYRAHFAGQTEQMFTIAQHSLLVVDLMPPELRNKPLLGISALLHDSSEAYTGDIVKPLKLKIPAFIELENRITKVIFDKYGLDTDYLKIIKPYDEQALEIEYKAFFTDESGIDFWSPEKSLYLFMDRWYRYQNMIEENNKQCVLFNNKM